MGASHLRALIDTPGGKKLTIVQCDVSDDVSIIAFARQVKELAAPGGVLENGLIDCVVLNAGVLVYPNRISEM